jgi:predicted nuclease of predicted toxin-antitoxin system
VTVRFLIDAQLPPALARHLVALGHEATHIAELGMVSARDREIWDRAAADGSVIITKDEDFVTMRALRSHGPAVIWIQIGNATKRTLLQRFTAALPFIIGALERGETIVQIPDERV